MTKMNDNTVPFGKTAEEIICDIVMEYDYPVYLVSLPGILMIIEHWLWEEKRELKPGRKLLLKV